MSSIINFRNQLFTLSLPCSHVPKFGPSLFLQLSTRLFISIKKNYQEIDCFNQIVNSKRLILEEQGYLGIPCPGYPQYYVGALVEFPEPESPPEPLL